VTSLRSGHLGAAFWSDVAHLGGAAAAAVWIWGVPMIRGTAERTRARINRGAWERKMKQRLADQAEIDRILEKIHQQGLNSLSRHEKKTLQDATHRQRRDDKDLYRL